MNQPQQSNVPCDFQWFLVCQVPKDVVEIKLEIKTKWEKFTLHKHLHTRTEKYRPWNKVSCRVRVHSRRRQPHHNRTEDQHNTSTDSGTFITSGQGMGYPTKIFYADSDSYRHSPAFSQLRGILQDLYLQEDKVYLQANARLGCRLNGHNLAGLPQ